MIKIAMVISWETILSSNNGFHHGIYIRWWLRVNLEKSFVDVNALNRSNCLLQSTRAQRVLSYHLTKIPGSWPCPNFWFKPYLNLNKWLYCSKGGNFKQISLRFCKIRKFSNFYCLDYFCILSNISISFWIYSYKYSNSWI